MVWISFSKMGNSRSLFYFIFVYSQSVWQWIHPVNRLNCLPYFFLKKNWPFSAYFFLFSIQSKVGTCTWIWTEDLWCQKRPLYRLSHNHCPSCAFLFGLWAFSFSKIPTFARFNPCHFIGRTTYPFLGLEHWLRLLSCFTYQASA